MTTTVYLIRHGKTIDGEEKRYKGHIDVPLSEEGTQQIERLARLMKDRVDDGLESQQTEHRGLDRIYCSDLSRAVTSAEIIAKPFGLKPTILQQLRERSFGRWEGMTFDEIGRMYPEEFEAWAKDPLKFSPVGGESTEAVRERVMPVFREIVTNNSNRNIAIVAHGGVNRIILCDILGMSLRYIFRIEQDFGAINVLKFYNELPVVKTMNYTHYL